MPVDIPNLLRAAGGSIIGKVRLQKVVYLLDQIGMNSGFEFNYHHYGPYSADLTSAVDDATIFDEVVESVRSRASDGVPYSVFEVGDNAQAPEDARSVGDIEFDRARHAIRVMSGYSATVLELAATIHWLVCVEEQEDWEEELHDRKGIKAAGGRTKEALKLLGELGISLEA
jgi:uncharacterized protein YwgA